MLENLITNEFDDLIKRSMPNVEILGEVETRLHLNGFLSTKAMQKGAYFFVDELKEPKVKIEGINDKFYLVARGICLINFNGETLGHIAEFNISSLISSLSTHHNRKASKLYGVPSEPKTDEKWNNLKETYIRENLMKKVIIVEKTEKANELNWRFGSNADFNDLKEAKQSDALKAYLADNPNLML